MSSRVWPAVAYAAVVAYATGFKDDLTPAREKGLLEYVGYGGGIVGIHAGGADCFAGNLAYVELMNGVFKWHPAIHEFNLNIAPTLHPITAGMKDFLVLDEMYQLQKFIPARCTLLVTTIWEGKPQPMAFVREHGQGRAAHLASGHTQEIWGHPEFQKLVSRSIEWVAGKDNGSGD